jgi:NAD(P) transhydrogenase subunit alpha
MMQGMKPGAVVVDLAAEQGGNCELTRAGETVLVNGVQVLGPVNVASLLALHASQLYAKNIASFVRNLCDEQGQLVVNLDDEIIRDTLVVRDGAVVNARVRENAGWHEGDNKSAGADDGSSSRRGNGSDKADRQGQAAAAAAAAADDDDDEPTLQSA